MSTKSDLEDFFFLLIGIGVDEADRGVDDWGVDETDCGVDETDCGVDDRSGSELVLQSSSSSSEPCVAITQTCV